MKTSSFFILILFLSCSFHNIFGQVGDSINSVLILGTYKGVICSQNDCTHEKLKIKKNNKFVLVSVVDFEGRKFKSKVVGVWKLDKTRLELKTKIKDLILFNWKKNILSLQKDQKFVLKKVIK